jgi:hypothetical protein
LKETRPLWPPQRGVGLQEPNLGKTNLRVSLAHSLEICFAPSLADSFFISNANPACSCVYICKFQFRPIHPPSRRLSRTNGQVERANGMIIQGLKPRIFNELSKFGTRWLNELPSMIWSLRTTPCNTQKSHLDELKSSLKEFEIK